MTEAIDRAAGDAGRRLGGESIAKQAVQEVLELMSSEGTRSSNSAPQNTFLNLGVVQKVIQTIVPGQICVNMF